MRVLIADDERIARNRLRHLLAGEPGIQVAGECANGYETVRMLREMMVDVLFLDIQMPGTDGMAIARSVASNKATQVVFVTAYDEYAVEAFAVRAFDYLLKPFDRERFQETVTNLRSEWARKRSPESAPDWRPNVISPSLPSVMNALERRPALKRLAIQNRGNMLVVDIATIDWIEAADNYVCLHCGATTHVMRETLNALESRLDPEQFFRIHRSAIVNASQIREIQPWFRGDNRVILHGGTTLILSRTYREQVKRRLRV